MSSPISQDLAQKIIEVLLQRGHVLLSKGGKPALVRELSDRMNDTLATIIGRLPPPGIVDNEVTSTFGDEALDDAVEEMVEDVAASLMDSDQVEDVFSEDAVIRRDVFRVVKDALLSADRAFGESEEADVEVALQTLGYVATKAAQGADPAVVEVALSRAAKASRAKLLKYTPATQTALFRAALGTPDARLELEEAVADELSNLVDEGKVALPMVERRIPIGRPVASDERHATRARIDVAATRTLLRSGCTATWEYAGDDTISVSLVPMSDQDGRAVDPFVEAFAREVQAVFNRPRAAEPSAGAGLDAWLRLAHDVRPSPARPAEPKSSRPTEKLVEKAPASRRSSDAPLAGARASDRPAPASKRAVEKAPVSKRAEEKAAPVSRRGEEKAAPVSRRGEEKAAPVSRRGEEKAPSSQRSLASKPARKDLAAKNVKAAPKEPKVAPKAPKVTAKKAAPKEPKAAPKARKATAKKKASAKAGPRSETKSKPRAKVAKKAPRGAAGKIARRPAKKPVAKKPAAKKPAAKKPVAKKSLKRIVARKPARKPVVKKAVVKKAVAKKPVRKPAAKKPARKLLAKKPVAKKPARKLVAKRPVARAAKKLVRKPVAKKPVGKKPVGKKPVGKKPVAKKVSRKPIAKKRTAKPARKPVSRKPAARRGGR